MTTSASASRLPKGGIVLLDPDTSDVLRIIRLQYNSDRLTRTLAPKSLKESGDRLEALRLKGPPKEMITLSVEIDATDQFERANPLSNAIGRLLQIRPPEKGVAA
jgi:hypothetical protein